ncbi:MAG: glycosyltransferase AglD [Candidatus Woesearchaeota archaeon]|nr:glycosyltransferase AglD [Candidatus Woesearchaeota archaeon]
MNISVIIPTINSEHRIEKAINHIQNYLESSDFIEEFEIIIAAQSSNDDTFGKIKTLESKNIKPLFIEERGKGKGIQEGIKAASNPWICFIDDDLSYPIEFLEDCAPLLDNYDIFIGSRTKGSREGSLSRKIAGKLFHLYVSVLFSIPQSDIQAGLKLFRASIFDNIPLPKENGYLWDTLFLYYANKEGLRIKEIPISFEDKPNQLHLFSSAVNMGGRALVLWWNVRILKKKNELLF